VNLVIAAAVVLATLSGTAVVFTHPPKQQALALSMFGLLLTVLFLTLQAPDVALSELVINALVVPLIILLAAEKVKRSR
jgi:energy-converting hydrogenase B subunit D